MTAENYEACIDKVLEYEGGYTQDPNDKGNWTGCNVGVGINKGTNRGISACAYPNEDIKNMTLERCHEIYRKDYWDVVCGDDIPAGPDLCTFDGGVNSGPSRGVTWLQRAVGATPDGVVGPETLAAANRADDHVTVDRMCDDRLDFLRGLSTWDIYGKGWTNRVNDVRSTAHSMVDEERPVPIPPPIEPVASVTIDISSDMPVRISVTINGEPV